MERKYVNSLFIHITYFFYSKQFKKIVVPSCSNSNSNGWLRVVATSKYHYSELNQVTS